MNRNEFIIATAVVLFVAFLLGWFAYWLLHRFSRSAGADMNEVERMAQELHEAEEVRDQAIAYYQAREAELMNRLQQTEAELNATMDGLREARAEAEGLKEYIEQENAGPSSFATARIPLPLTGQDADPHDEETYQSEAAPDEVYVTEPVEPEIAAEEWVSSEEPVMEEAPEAPDVVEEIPDAEAEVDAVTETTEDPAEVDEPVTVDEAEPDAEEVTAEEPTEEPIEEVTEVGETPRRRRKKTNGDA